MMSMKLSVETKVWPLREPFTISRGTMTQCEVIVTRLEHGGHVGRGEAVGVDYHGETLASMLAQLEEIRPKSRARRDASGASVAAASGRRAQCNRHHSVGSRIQAQRQARLGSRRHQERAPHRDHRDDRHPLARGLRRARTRALEIQMAEDQGRREGAGRSRACSAPRRAECEARRRCEPGLERHASSWRSPLRSRS